MKICILANSESVHTRRWVRGLCDQGAHIVLISTGTIDMNFYGSLVHFAGYSLGYDNSLNRRDNKLGKLRYLWSVTKIRRILSAEKPAILHAHYASSYGLLGALSRFHPYIISVWGSDVYEFPRSSFIARKILKFSLSQADKILSTSHAMAVETTRYNNRTPQVTPFGVDTDIFRKGVKKVLFNEDDLVIGTIKSLEEVYGIDLLIKAFASVAGRSANRRLRLLIVGSGSCEAAYKDLANELGISDRVVFTGFVDHSVITEYYNAIDIFVVPSLNESFGVAVIEASACQIPVIVTRVGGLPEVVEDGKTGIIVEPLNTEQLEQAIDKLITNEALREEMGKNGRERVLNHFQWHKNVVQMMEIYQSLSK